MKQLITGCLLLLSTFGACQQKPSKHSERNNMDQKMLDIYKQVKTDEQNPWYEVEFSADGCGYELLINDFPLTRYFLFGRTHKQRIQINDQILGSGKQSITVRMFPPQLSDQSYSSVLVNTSAFSVKVLRRKADGGSEDAKMVFELVSPNRPGTSSFIGSGQKFFEFKGVFQAQVPYQLEGWKNGKDLSEENQAVLEKEAVTVFNNFRDILVKKDTNAYAALMYSKEVELAKAFYWAKSVDSKERWEEMKGSVLEQRDILPIKDYKLVLYAGGKVLALVPTAQLYKDYYSVVRAQTKTNDINYSFFLYKKEGSNVLTPIR